jgi:hypothetical protein
MAPPKIASIIVTATTFESLPGLFSQGGRGGPLIGIGSEATYGALFAKARTAAASDPPRTPSLPWPRSTGQGFWSRYFEGRDFANISERNAWRNLVPLRLGQPKVSFGGGKDGRAHAEVFVYPHGLLASTTMRLWFEPARADAPDALLAALSSPAQLADGTVKANRFDQLGIGLLDHTRQTALDPKLAPGLRSAPFTVSSIVGGTDVDPAIAVDEGDPIHRLLDAFATLDPGWKANALSTLADRKISSKTAPPGHILYGRKRARVVWFPYHFSGLSGRPHAINCYHRNLTLTSGTIEALSGLVLATAGELAKGRSLNALPLHWEALARRSVVLLSQFWLGKNTYATEAAKRQLADGARTETEALRAAYGLMPAGLPA